MKQILAATLFAAYVLVSFGFLRVQAPAATPVHNIHVQGATLGKSWANAIAKAIAAGKS